MEVALDELVPQKLKIAAITQIVSGVLSLVMSWATACMVGVACGAVTLGFGGQVCGLLPFLLIPVGLIEIGVGIYGLLNPREAANAMRLVSFLEMGAVLCGGLTSAVCGAVVYALIGSDEVVGYLEG